MTKKPIHPAELIQPLDNEELPPLTWRHQYDRNRDQIEQKLSDMIPAGESLTVQSGKEDADINVIAKRMGATGQMPQPLDLSFYQDASDLPDLRAILEYSREAERAFMALPPEVRKRFHNSAAELWEFVLDDNNREEAVRIGLIDAKAPEGTQEPENGPEKGPETTPKS